MSLRHGIALGFVLLATSSVTAGRLELTNEKIRVTIMIDGDRLERERVETLQTSSAPAGPGPGPALESDAGFTAEIVWTGWHAPGKTSNADNLCRFGARDFAIKRERRWSGSDGETLALDLEGPKGLAAELIYQLPAESYFYRRRLKLLDPGGSDHFLHALWTLDAALVSTGKIVHAGGFGQPVALELGRAGAFLGLEWPAADNVVLQDGNALHVRCGQEMGEVISKDGVAGETVVTALTPDSRVKYWFGEYLDTIRAAPLRPYALYNSWYDLRSAEYPRIRPDQVMSEENVLRIIGRIRAEMVDRHGITLDAFVLDDGWDVYESDWVLRSRQFPHGLAPIVSELRKMNTRLGLWLGPTGGYSFRDRRVAWMRDNGYEVSGDQLWIAGPKYRELLSKRTTDFAREGVAYFKWDGLQFCSSGPGLGTLPGIYSRRAALLATRDLARAVREVNPELFLNVTSGTWLSPWWLRIADQIWMQGQDYGSAGVPSISRRDSSITYRDLVLYEDFRTNGLWFPISSLMTHGILKGSIDVEEIGSGEPLSKFADEVVFYLARGVSMYELYISPDKLKTGEWEVLAGALRWARNRFEVLSRGEMIGGNPGRREPYGYAHFRGARGILAVRNPDVEARSLRVALDPALGLEPSAKGLILERVYPTRWIAPRLFDAGDEALIGLGGYEAAVYELRPIAEVGEPVLAGVVFAENPSATEERIVTALEIAPDARLLNPASLARMTIAGKEASADDLARHRKETPALVSKGRLESLPGQAVEASFRLHESARDSRFALLIEPDAVVLTRTDPVWRLEIDGRTVEPERMTVPGKWVWLSAPIAPGSRRVRLSAVADEEPRSWTGSVSAWIVGSQRQEGTAIGLRPTGKAPSGPLPPTGRDPHELPRCVPVGNTKLSW